ncbi:MAG TPA: sugar phosphate isomerase/epimerase family protein [bacterium]|nr:MAG: Xylose isomerase-like TIM barrel [bacterium ADurb.Bin236]HOY63041.1 sugar phosphate isomerase/epimerase family protein [bacterium]HPI76577.1 sugar phosphate isomerase/epimerase family protein [bacterium]HPN95334.1 sugar phosphate isomerase/epimerase family protein [bacterium]
MRPAISTQIFGHDNLIASDIRMIRESGFDAVEVYGVPPHFDCMDSGSVSELAAMLDGEGLNAVSVHMPYIDPAGGGAAARVSITAGGVDNVKRATARALACVEAAAVLRAPVVVAHCGSYNDPLNGETASNLASFIASVAAAFKSAGVRLALENVASAFSSSVCLPRFLAANSFGIAGVCFDAAHAHISEDSARAVLNYGSLIEHVHISDNDGSRDRHLLPMSEGCSVDWPAVVGALQAIKYSGSVTLEARPDSAPASFLKSCRDVFDALKIHGD